MAGATGGTSGLGDELWDLLERTRPSVIDPAAHAEAFTSELVGAGLDTTLEVGRQFDRAMAQLNTWDLWAALYALLLGCSDDTFEYARAWIVGRGRDAFDLARRDPEGYVVRLVEGTDHDESLVAERIEDLWVLDGEPLLYATGVAHERLTGVWRPADADQDPDSDAGPLGEPWGEDAVADRVPRLVAALPEGWLGDDGPVDLDQVRFATPAGELGLTEMVREAMTGDLGFDTARRVSEGVMAHESGDSRLAAELLGPVTDDPARWALVPGSAFAPNDVAYAAGMSRLLVGDVDGAAAALRLGLEGAATALRLGLDGRRTDERIRRALAQVELTRGELGAAERLLDASPKADLMDQALVVTLRWRQGRRDEADRLASALVNAKPRRQQRGQHPWTVAGVLVQAAQVLAELGATRTLAHALERAFGLIRGAPAELPLRGQLGVLLAAARRLEGRVDEADEVLASTAPLLDPGTCDLGLHEVERARSCRALGDAAGASTWFAQAVATFEAAGERWHATQARAEASAPPAGSPS